MSRNWKLPRPGDSEFTTLLTEGAATRENLCLQSEDFSTTWTQTNATATFNQTPAPDGSSTADKLVDNAATGTGQVQFRQTVTVADTTEHTFSVFAKEDQLSWIYLTAILAGANPTGYFNLGTGAKGTVTNVNDSGIEECDNGWYRCWLSFTTGTEGGSINLRIYCADADSDITVDLDGTSSIFVWGGQLEESSTPTFYIPTTTVARTITGTTATGNFQDDVRTALETVLETTGSIDDLWKRYKFLT